MRKRVLSSILAIAMLLSLLPTTVFAAGADKATVDGTPVQGIGDALRQAENGSTITLLGNVFWKGEALKVFEKATKSNSLTIDLNGHKLTVDRNIVVKDGALTIKDSIGDGSINSAADQMFNLKDGGSLTIIGGTFVGGSEQMTFVGGSAKGNTTITGGTFFKDVSPYVDEDVAPYVVSANSVYTYYSDWNPAYDACVAAGDGAKIASTGKLNETKVTVTLDDNYEGADTVTYTTTEGTSIELPSPERAGYTFSGWSHGNQLYQAGTPIPLNGGGEKTFTAVWTGTDCTVSYACYNSAGNTATVNLPLGTTCVLKDAGDQTQYTVSSQQDQLPNPTKAGNVFLGWTYWNDQGAPTFTAKWALEQDLGSVAYNKLSSFAKQTLPDSEAQDANIVAQNSEYFEIQREGNNTFTVKPKDELSVGTYEETIRLVYQGNNSLFKAYQVTLTVTESANVTVSYTGEDNHAAQAAVPAGTTITIDPNGGTYDDSGDYTNRQDRFTVAVTENIRLADPTKVGAAFAGWTYNDEENTFTAKWTANQYTVTFQYNNGTQDNETQQVAYGETVAAPEKNPTYLGHTFTGWYLNSNGDSSLDESEKYTFSTPITGDITLDAGWTVNQYTVTFNGNGGTVAGKDTYQVTKNYGVEANAFADGQVLRNGAEFLGWARTADGDVVYAPADKILWDFTDNTTVLYAIWDVDQFTITYHSTDVENDTETVDYGTVIKIDPNGGTYNAGGNYTNKTTAFDYPVTENIQLAVPTQDGYTFLGWTYANGTFTAQWNREQYNISFLKHTQDGARYASVTVPAMTEVKIDPNGGTYNGSNEVQSVEISTDPYAIVDATRSDGYNFTGWKYDENTHTFTAQWAEVSYTVTFDADNGQENTEQTVTAQTGFKVTQPDVPTKAGYTFDGWMYQGKYWDFDTPVSGNATFTAVWVPKQYNVTFDCNGGTINGKEIQTYTGTYGKDAAPWAQGIVQRQGYTFAGWSQDRNGEVAFDPDDRFPADWTQDITLYAVWVANGQEVTYTAYSEDGATAGRVEIPYDTKIVIDPANGTYKDGDFTSTSQFTHMVTGETTLQDPTRTGYEFLGWTYDAEDQIFTAQWDVQQYTVYFHGNGGTVAGRDVYSVAGPYGEAKAPFNTSVLVREGYTFQGWAITADEDSTVRYSPTASFPWTWEKEETNLYAVWTPNKYTVTFDGNGGTVAGKTEYSVTKKYGENAPAFADGKVLREGAEFLGWSADSNATVATYGPRDSIRWTFAEDTTLYAVWDVYDLTFRYKDSGTGNLTTLELPYGTKVTVVPNGGSFGNGEAANYTKVLNQDDYLMDPGRSGYTFLGWTYDATTHTFTAQWETITYTVTFDANGGEGTMEPQTFQAGVTKALSKNAFTKNEAVFVGWSTEKDGGDEGWSFTDQQEITFENISSNLTLYAQWKTNAYSFTYWKYNGNSDSSWDNALAFEAGEVVNVNPVGGTYNGHNTLYSMTISSDPNTQKLTYDISRPGCTFLGWEYTASTKTFVAKWAPVKYTITFDGNGGTVNGELRQDVSATYGTDLDPWNPDVLVWEGYTFQGWSRNSNGSVFLDPDDRIPCSQWTENVTLYAIWEGNQYTISYEKYRANQDTSLWTTTAPIPYGTQITIDLAGGTYDWADTIFTLTGDTALPKPTKAGCEFLGWKYVARNHTFKAQWKEMTFTVTFDANGGTGEMDPQTFRANEPQYLTDNAFTKEGATFAGWNTAQDWSGTHYKDRQQVTFRETDQSMTLFAKWETIQYTVTFDANGGQWTNNDVVRTKTVDYQTAVQAPNDPSRTGYVFAGWVREDGRDWNFDWTVGNNLTLKAKWVEATYEFTYPAFNDWETPIETTMIVTFGEQFTVNLNGGDSYYTHQGDFSFTVDETEATHALDSSAVRAGYDFAGWSYDAGSKTFTANWAEKTYSVTFNANGGFFNDKSTTSTVEVTQNKYVDLPNAGDVSREGGYVLLGWSEKQNGNLQYDLSTVSNIPYDQNKGNLILYAVWAQVVDFGTVPYGTAPLKTVDYDAAVYSCPNASDQSFFKMSVDNEDTTVLRIRPDSELAPSKTPYVDLIRVVLNSGEIHYIQAKATVVPKEMTISTDLNESKLYTVGETFQVFVTAAPGQDLTLDCAGAGVSLECVSELTEVADTPGTYVATYKVVKIPADQQELTFTVKDNTYDATATLEKTINLRTLVIVTVKDGDGSEVNIGDFYLYDLNDTNRREGFQYNSDSETYTALADKSGWDYVQFITKDGRTITLETTSTGAKVADAILDNTGIVTIDYSFADYTVIGRLYVNGTWLQDADIKISVSGNYGEGFNPDALKDQAHSYVYQRYGEPIGDAFDTTVTTVGGHPLYLETFGQTGFEWDANNTLAVEIHITVGYNVFYHNGDQLEFTEFVKHGEFADNPPALSKEGYALTGWYTDSDCTQPYDFATPVTGNLNLYAKWERGLYTVTFNNGYGGSYGADTPWAPQYVEYWRTVTPPTENPTRSGYSFQGWSTTADGTSGYWNFSEDKIKGDTTLYAIWTGNPYTVTLDANDGIFTLQDGTTQEIGYKDVTYGSPVGEMWTPTREGYTFAGWKDEYGYDVTADTIYLIEGDSTFYAQWEPEFKTYTVTFHLNYEGAAAATTDEVREGQTVTKPEDPSREGYTFTGWSTTEDGTSGFYNFSSPVKEDVTLYAQWEEDTISGQGQFIVKEQTRTVVALKNNDGTPLDNIPDLRLTIKSADGSRTFVNGMKMRELSESEIPYVWDKSFAYYTLEDHVKLTGSVVYTLEAEGYTFTYKS